MTATELLYDIQSLQEETFEFERKYGLRTDLFFASYMQGVEPEDDSWVMDFGQWASAYQLLLERRVQYLNVVEHAMRSKDNYFSLIQVAT